MKRIGLMIGFFALLIAVLPTVPAQDVKKDDTKTEKKDDANKDEAKKDDAKKDEAKKDDAKKDDAKKDDAKKDEPKKDEAKKDDTKKDESKKDDEKKKAESKKSEKEKINAGAVLTGVKIVSAGAESASEFTIEVQELDPKKVYDTNVWATQRQVQLMQELFNAQKQKGQGYLQAMFNYQKNLANFQMEMIKRQAGNYSPKNIDVKAAENAKVRIMFLPTEFDDAGAVKKWTKKEIEARKDKTGLPGFPADFDAIKSGQYIDLYMAKPPPVPKAQPKKKGPDDEDVPVAKTRPEYLMIVIRSEPMPK